MAYNTSICASACQLLDPLLTQCMRQEGIDKPDTSNGVGLEPQFDCMCPDLNVGNIRTTLLNTCTVCDVDGLGTHALQDYQYYDLMCNVYNNVPAAPGSLAGGPENAAGETEQGTSNAVRYPYSQTCLSQLRGSSYANTASYADYFSCARFDAGSAAAALRTYAMEMHLTVPTVAPSASATPSTSAAGASSAMTTPGTGSSSTVISSRSTSAVLASSTPGPSPSPSFSLGNPSNTLNSPVSSPNSGTASSLPTTTLAGSGSATPPVSSGNFGGSPTAGSSAALFTGAAARSGDNLSFVTIAYIFLVSFRVLF